MSTIIRTTDGHDVTVGSVVWCYYATPMQYGTICNIEPPYRPTDEQATDPWADVTLADGNRGYFNGERLAIRDPKGSPPPKGPQ